MTLRRKEKSMHSPVYIYSQESSTNFYNEPVPTCLGLTKCSVPCFVLAFRTRLIVRNETTILFEPRDTSYTFPHDILFRFLSSGPSSSSSSVTLVGFSRAWTLLAMLLRRVGGADASRPLKGNFGPGSCHPSLLGLPYDGGPWSGGGVT